MKDGNVPDGLERRRQLLPSAAKQSRGNGSPESARERERERQRETCTSILRKIERHGERRSLSALVFHWEIIVGFVTWSSPDVQYLEVGEREEGKLFLEGYLSQHYYLVQIRSIFIDQCCAQISEETTP